MSHFLKGIERSVGENRLRGNSIQLLDTGARRKLIYSPAFFSQDAGDLLWDYLCSLKKNILKILSGFLTAD